MFYYSTITGLSHRLLQQKYLTRILQNDTTSDLSTETYDTQKKLVETNSNTVRMLLDSSGQLAVAAPGVRFHDGPSVETTTPRFSLGLKSDDPTVFVLRNAATNQTLMSWQQNGLCEGSISLALKQLSDVDAMPTAGAITTGVLTYNATNQRFAVVLNNVVYKDTNEVIIGLNATSETANTVVIGQGAKARKFKVGTSNLDLTQGGIAIGNGASSWAGSFVMGNLANTTARYSVTIGTTAYTEGDYSFCLGNGAQAISAYASSIGNSSFSDGEYALAMGYQARARGRTKRCVCIGYNATTTAVTETAADDGVVIGTSAEIIYPNTVAIGNTARAVQAQAVAIGYQAQGKATYAVAVGPAAIANTESVSIGYNAASLDTTTNAVCIGKLAKAQNAASYTVVIGDGASTSTVAGKNASNSIAIGRNAFVENIYTTAIGKGARATQQNAFALGVDAQATGTNTFALGAGANAAHTGSIAFGNAAASTANYQFILSSGVSWSPPSRAGFFVHSSYMRGVYVAGAVPGTMYFDKYSNEVTYADPSLGP